MRAAKLQWVLLIGGTLSLIFTFQNCGQVALNSPEVQSYASTSSKATGLICLPADEILETFLIKNINAKLVGGQLQMDSDGDGLSDAEETSAGTNPLNRRTAGKVLDSICQQVDYQVQCNNLNLTCSGVPEGFGLTDCDVEALQLGTLFDHPTQGLDSDKDGVSDYFEILTGTFPNINDSSSDPDQDGIPNLLEIERGSNPRQADLNMSSALQNLVQKTKLPPSVNCAGDLWQVNINQVPLVMAKSYQSDSNPLFNHQMNENVVFMVLKTRPRAGSNINAKMYLYSKKIQIPLAGQTGNLNFNFTFTDFQLLGEIEP